MSEDHTNYLLDVEFKRYLQIMRPYLRQLVDHDIIELCNSWIQRLSNCDDSEKNTRNNYVFTMCYQLARGILNKPFLGPPPEFELPTLVDEFGSECSSDINFIVINTDDRRTKTLYNCKKAILSDTDLDTQYVDDEDERKAYIDTATRSVTSRDCKSTHSREEEQLVYCYTCPKIGQKKTSNKNLEQNTNNNGEEYEYRTTNLVMRLREIKKQNLLLNKELRSLKEESKKPLSGRTEEDYYEDHSLKLDTATSPHSETDQTFQLLAEEKEKNHFLIGKIEGLQEQLNYYNDIRRQDMEDVIAKHKQEVIKIKENILEECKKNEDDRVKQKEEEHENKMLRLRCAHEQEIELLKKNYENKLRETENLVENKDKEIANLKSMMAADQGVNLKVLLEKFLEKPNDNSGAEGEKLKVQELQKQLTKMEKSKAKCVKMYENKIASLEREKNMSDCSLQLQLARHRVKIFNEISDENQTELNTALTALETKYKEIIANVQATAIQRRMQDQNALEAILKAACSLHSDFPMYIKKRPLSTNITSAKDSPRDPRGYDTDVTELLREHENNNNVPNNHSNQYESEQTAGYCLDGERLNKLFQKVYVPQRDNENANKMH